MSVNALDEHEGEYRARQIRLATWIAVGVILIGDGSRRCWRTPPLVTSDLLSDITHPDFLPTVMEWWQYHAGST